MTPRHSAFTCSGRQATARRKVPKTWVKVLVLSLLFPFAALLLPTTLVVATMMGPTFVAYITDRSREKHLAITVGLMNFAGTLPAIIDLWSSGQSHQAATDLIGDIFVWAVAYAAAFAGWVLFAVMPSFVGAYFRMTTKTRMLGLVRKQKALIAEWGHAVAEGLEVTLSEEDLEDEDKEESAEEEEEEVEMTEAELVQAKPGR